MTSNAVANASIYKSNATNGNPMTKQSNGSSDSFMDVLSQTADSNSSKNLITSASKQSKDNTAADKRDQSSKVDSKKISDSKEEPKEIKESQPMKESQESGQTTKVQPDESDVKKAVEESAEQIQKEIADKMNVSEEDVIAAMEKLGIQMIDLLNPEVLSSLLLEISGETDAMALLTDESLYTALNELTEVVNELGNEMKESIELSDEEWNQMLEDANVLTDETAAGKETIADGKELIPTISGESEKAQNHQTQTEPALVVETTKENVKPTKAENNVENELQVEEHSAGEDKIQQVNAESQKEGMANQQEGTSKESDLGLKEETKQIKPNKEQKADNTTPITPNFTNQLKENLDFALQRSQASLGTRQAEPIMKQLIDYMKIHIGGEVTEMEMQLHPASLGTINLQVAFKDGALTAQLTAQNQSVKEAIESQVVQLRETLNEQGVKVEAIEVTIASHEFERNLQQGSGENNPSQEQNKQARRNINLDSLESMDEFILDEAEKIAVEIMENNGNTVDFTA